MLFVIHFKMGTLLLLLLLSVKGPNDGNILTFFLTVSLIFEPASLKADVKNEPKCLACCVTFVVTGKTYTQAQFGLLFITKL